MNKLWVFVLLGLLLSIGSVSAVCTYTYNNEDGQDYFGINTASDNVTEVSITEKWTAWDYFTPRLNFTRVVNESITGGITDAYSQIHWFIYDNACNTTAVLKNGSSTIDASNYTFIWINQTAGTCAFKWRVDTYNNTAVVVTCNRTFTKNVDDIIYASTTINSDTSRSSWLIENTPSDYGDYKTFRFNGASYGNFVNISNWAVGWNYTVVDCSVGTYGCNSSASNLWGMLVLVVVAGFLLYLVTTFFEGNITIALIIYLAIVAMLIPFLIDILNLGC